MVLKVKTKWGKHTLIEDRYSRTEKFCPWERPDRRVKISTRRKRMPDVQTLMMILKVTL